MHAKTYLIAVVLIFMFALFLAFPRTTAKINTVSYDVYSPQARPEYLSEDELKDLRAYLPNGEQVSLFWQRAGLKLELPTGIDLSEVVFDDLQLSTVYDDKAIDAELDLAANWLEREVQDNRNSSLTAKLPTYLVTLALDGNYASLGPGRYRLNISAQACGSGQCMPFFVSYRFEKYRYRSASSPILNFLGGMAKGWAL